MLIATASYGQFEKPRDIDFTVSQPYKVVDASSKNYFFQDGEVLSIKVVKKKAIVQKFDAESMKEKSRKELDMPKSFSLETVTKFGGRYLVFYSIWDKDRGNEQLFYREIDFKSTNWKGAAERAVLFHGKISGAPLGSVGMFSFGVTDKFAFYYSSDMSKLMVEFRKVPDIKSDAKSHDIIGLYVFDSEMKELWGDDLKMPYTEKKMNNIDYTVDKEGNAYILSTVFEDNTTKTHKRHSDEPNYHIELLRRDVDSKKLVSSEINLNGNFINNVWIYQTADDNMVCAGFYNKSDSRGEAEGVFYAKLDQTGKISDEQTYPIPIEILNQYESKRTRKRNDKKEDKGKAEFSDLELRKLQFLDDGSIILIGEQYYVIEHTVSNGRTTSTYYTYHYNDLLVTKIDSKGDLAWMRKLPKSQVGTSGRGSMSFKHVYDNGYHYFLFLDNEKNLNLPFDEAPDTYSDGKSGNLTAYIVDDANGEVSKDMILDMRDAKGVKLYQFEPSKIMKISENEFIFEAYKKKKEDVMVKISLSN